MKLVSCIRQSFRYYPRSPWCTRYEGFFFFFELRFVLFYCLSMLFPHITISESCCQYLSCTAEESVLILLDLNSIIPSVNVILIWVSLWHHSLCRESIGICIETIYLIYITFLVIYLCSPCQSDVQSSCTFASAAKSLED
jgi:hypothetical protein